MAMAAGPLTAATIGAELDGVAERLSSESFRPALDHCRDLLVERVAQNFTDSATAAGEHWAPHAPATVRRYGPHPLLILSGRLEAAASGRSGEAIRDVQDREVTIGVSGIPYASYHETGTSKMPTRPFMNINDATAGQCADVVADFALREIVG